MRTISIGLVAGMVLVTACSPAPDTAASSSPTPASTSAALSPAAAPTPLSISVMLSAKAVEKLVADGDKVVLSANYYGAPKPDLPADPANSPGVPLGVEEQRLDPAASLTVKLAGAYDAAKAAAQTVGEVQVLINVVSSDIERGRYPMECTTFNGPLKEAAELGDAVLQINCKAFGEG